MMRAPGRCPACILIAAFFLAAATVSTSPVIHQKGRSFSSAVLTIKRGEPVTFLNDDNVPHNVLSDSPDNAFDLGSQAPGSATPVTFDKAGIVAVICAIHPRMRMTIVVTN
jgi:plastocyanin